MAVEYTRLPVNTLQGINTELTKIQEAFNDALSRTNTQTNFMDTDLDMNNERILNLPEPVSDIEPVRVKDVTAIASAAQGAKITRDSSEGFPPTTGYVAGTELKFTDTYKEYTLLPSSDGDLMWVEDGNVGDELDIRAPTSFDTEAQVVAQGATSVRVGQKVNRLGYYTLGDKGTNWGIVFSGNVVTTRTQTRLSDTLYIKWNTVGTKNLRAFGIKGDGSDESDAMLEALGVGCKLHGNAEDTYLFTKQITLPANTDLDLRGSTTNFNLSIQTQCYYSSENNGRLVNAIIDVTALDGGGGANGAPVSFGSQATGVGVSGWEVSNLTVSTTRDNGNGVLFFGSCNNNKVSKIHAPDSSTLGRVVAFEWGGDDNVGTGHPYNNVVSNVTADNLTYSGDDGYMVWTSTAFNTVIKNIHAKSVNGMIGFFTGDRSVEWARDNIAGIASKGTTAYNITCPLVRKFGFRVYGKGSTSDIRLPHPVNVSEFYIQSNRAAGSRGVQVEFCDGPVFHDGEIQAFEYGATTGTEVERFKLKRVTIAFCGKNGASLGNSAVGSRHCVIQECHLYNNNQDGAAAGALASQVYINNAVNSACRYNRFGLSGIPETAVYAIFVGDQTQDTELSGNKVEVLAGGGAAFVGGSSNSYDINVHGANNQVVAGVTKWAGSPLYSIGEDGRRTFTRNAAPTTGTWSVGDKFYYDTPTTHIGAVCTTAGSGGTAVWTNFGAL